MTDTDSDIATQVNLVVAKSIMEIEHAQRRLREIHTLIKETRDVSRAAEAVNIIANIPVQANLGTIIALLSQELL